MGTLMRTECTPGVYPEWVRKWVFGRSNVQMPPARLHYGRSSHMRGPVPGSSGNRHTRTKKTGWNAQQCQLGMVAVAGASLSGTLDCGTRQQYRHVDANGRCAMAVD